MKLHSSAIEQAQKWFDAHREEFIRELQEWVRIPSVSRREEAAPGMPFGSDCKRMLDLIVERGRHYGFSAENLLDCAASVQSADGAVGIIAHADVVPAGEGWVYPPFECTWLEEYDVLIGRGVDDNKGAAVTGLFLMRYLQEAYPSLGIRLICGTDEEAGMRDMQLLKENGYAFPALSLVPDAGFPVNYGQKGSLNALLHFPCSGNLLSFDAGSVPNVIPDKAECTLSTPYKIAQAAFDNVPEPLRASITLSPCPRGTHIIARGTAGHAAFPAGADNAICYLSAFLSASGLLQGSCAPALQQVSELTKDPYGQSENIAFRDDISGELTLVYGVAHLKEGTLTLSADCRFPITCRGDALEEKLHLHWQERGAALSETERSDPFYLPANSREVNTLQEIYRFCTGRSDAPYTMGGGTYSKAVPNAVSFGPGMPGQADDFSAFLPEGHGKAHGRDEAAFLSKWRDLFVIYALSLPALNELIKKRETP